MKSRKLSDKEQRTPQRLLHAAKTLFSQKGYDGTTIKELVTLAKANISLVSYHFGGKDGLYKACIGDTIFEHLKIAQKILQPVNTEEEFKIRLKMYIQEMLLFYTSEPEITLIILREFEQNSPMLNDIFENGFVKILNSLIQFVQAAIDEGLADPHRDPKIMASIFFGYLTHLARTDHLTLQYYKLSFKDAKYQAHIVDQLMTFFWEGVRLK